MKKAFLLLGLLPFLFACNNNDKKASIDLKKDSSAIPITDSEIVNVNKTDDNTDSSNSTPMVSSIFPEILIGNQIWMSQNLNIDRFQNGDIITEAKTDEEWAEAGENGQAAWCYYENDPMNGEKYGKLYNWFAVFDKRGLAPEGWRVSTIKDWGELYDFILEDNPFLKGQNISYKIKSKSEWDTNDGLYKKPNGDDAYNFNALPGGSRSSSGFHHLKTEGKWWTSIPVRNYPIEANNLKIGSGNNSLYFDTENMKEGLSVRCVKAN